MSVVHGHRLWVIGDGEMWARNSHMVPSFHLNWGFPGDTDGKESACSAGDMGSIPGSG